MSSIIRTKFVLEWCERKRSERLDQWELIRKRDERLRNLNQEFGFFDEDGSPSTGRKTHIDADYKRAYDEIEAHFRQAMTPDLAPRPIGFERMA